MISKAIELARFIWTGAAEDVRHDKDDRVTFTAREMDRHRKNVAVKLLDEGLSAVSETHSAAEMAAVINAILPDHLTSAQHLQALSNILGRRAHELARVEGDG